MEQVPEVEVFIAPCGGGGLLAGCSAFLSSRAPDVEVWGVEAEGADDTARSLEAGKRVAIDLPDTIADGMRNVTPGELTFPMIKQTVRGVVLVSDDEIRQTLRLMMLRGKVVAEPTGAASVAAAIFGKVQLDGRTAVAVVSGGNVDPTVLTQVLESSG